MTLPDRPYRRRLVVNTASTAVANVWAMVVAIVSLPLLLHGLGATEFGIWVLVQTFSAVNGWLSLADLGLSTAAIHAVAGRAGAGDRKSAADVARTAIVMFAVLGAGCGLVLAVVGSLAFPHLFHTPAAARHGFRIALVLFGAQIFFDLLTEGSEACLEGFQRVDLSRLYDAIRRTLVAIATVAVALAGGGLEGVAVASLAASAVATVVAFSRIAVVIRADGGTFHRAEVRPLFDYARRVAVVDANGVVKRSMDKVIVGGFLGPAAVALVEVATQVQNGANAILSASSYAAISSSAWLRARGDAASLRELLERATRYSLLATWPVAVMTGVLAGPLVRLWVGHKYEAAAGLVAVALVPTASAFLQVGSNMLRGSGRVSLIFGPAVSSTAVNLVASVVLVKLVGVVGTFQGTIIGTLVLVPYLGRAILREYEITLGDFIRTSVRPAIAPNLALAAILGLVLWLPLGDVATVALGVVAGTAGYAAATVAWALQPGELAELRASARRGAPTEATP